jgi:hypothetical protein
LSEDSEEDERLYGSSSQGTSNEFNQNQETLVTVQMLLAQLAKEVNRDLIVRINVTRSSIWEGTLRAFRRKSFNPLHQILIRFADDDGVSEGAVDQGGPLREYFRLLLDYLFGSKLFIGGTKEKNVSLDLEGDYFKN